MLKVVPRSRKTFGIFAIFLVAALPVNSASAEILKWEILWGTSGFDTVSDVVLDSCGRIYVTGLTFEGPYGWDVFVAWFDRSGVLIGELVWGTLSVDMATAIAVDSRGNIYITGYTLSGPLGGEDAFIVAFDRLGVLRWELFWGTPSFDRAYGITVDFMGNAYIAGATAEDPLGYDAFVASFDPFGVLRWQTLWNSRPFDLAYAVEVDIHGNVYITGGTALSESGPFDVFTVSYDRSGVFRWEAIWQGSIICDWANGVAVDIFGNVYVAGIRSWGPFGDDDAFLVSYDSSGVFRWETHWGTSGLDQAFAVAVDIRGNVYIAGRTHPGPSGDTDAFIASFDSSGSFRWEALWGTNVIDVASGVAVDFCGNVYIGGYTATGTIGEYRAFLVAWRL